MHRPNQIGLVAALLLALTSWATASPAADQGTFLFVLSGTSGSVVGDTLTLKGVPVVVTFSDRPERIAVDVPLHALSHAGDAFAGDPPNAVLSVLTDKGITNVVLELTSATSDGSTASFGYKILAGDPPEGDFGPASLFVDGSQIPPGAIITIQATNGQQ